MIKSTLKKRLQSFRYAIAGLIYLFSTQANAKIHGGITVFVIGAGLFFSLTATEWCIIIITIVMVIGAEAINTALETLTDLVSPNFHELAGRAKDVAAAAVFTSALGAVCVGLIIFLPKVLRLLGWL